LARLLSGRGIGVIRAAIPIGYLDAELFQALEGTQSLSSSP
jgi:hypothetical protein